MAELPPLPPGFTLDKQANIPPLPPGFTLDSQQPQPERPLGHLTSGIGEPALAIASGTVGAAAGGLAGIGAAIGNRLGWTDAQPGDVVRLIQEAMTYQPRTTIGQGVTNVISYPFEKIAQLGDFAGGSVAEATDSPALGAAVNTGLQTVAGIGAGKVIGASGKAIRERINASPRPNDPIRPVEAGENQSVPNSKAAERPSGLEGLRAKAPSLEELKAQKDAAYKKAEETGVRVSRGAMTRLKVQLVNELKKEGMDLDLHPKAMAAAKRITEAKGPQSLNDLETLRKIANDAKGSMDKAEARLGAKIVDRLDEFEETLGQHEVISGDASAATAYKEARALNTKVKRSETIAELMDRAETKAGAHYTQAGMEHAIRAEFKQLALNKKELRRFSKEEQAAIKNIARGGKWENSLRNLGKFDPSSGGMAAFMSALLAGGGATSTGGASLLLPAAAFAAKRQATKLTARKVSALDEMVRAGDSSSGKRGKIQRNALATP